MPQESTAPQTVKFNATTLNFLLNCDYIFFPSSLRIQATFPVEAIVCEKHIFAEPKKKRLSGQTNQGYISQYLNVSAPLFYIACGSR